MLCKSLRDGFNHIDKINQLIHNFTGNFEKDRKKLRDNIIDLFKSENAGKGKGNLSTRVVYCVEKTKNEIIYLKRPAPLNNGFDFEVHTSSKLFFGRIKTRPSHKCIKTILNNLKEQNLNIYNQTQRVIDEIYNCDEKNISSICYTFDGIDVEVLLKSIKWLFVEQDVTYWSYSGRTMLYNGLKNV
jgi:hypothetical protein